MIWFIAPSGGNNSYICLKLLGKVIENTTTYHDAGSHSDDKKVINFMLYADRTEQTQIVITENYNNIKHLIAEGDTVIQNYIDKEYKIKIFNDNWIKIADSENLYFKDDVNETEIIDIVPKRSNFFQIYQEK